MSKPLWTILAVLTLAFLLGKGALNLLEKRLNDAESARVGALNSHQANDRNDAQLWLDGLIANKNFAAFTRQEWEDLLGGKLRDPSPADPVNYQQSDSMRELILDHPSKPGWTLHILYYKGHADSFYWLGPPGATSQPIPGADLFAVCEDIRDLLGPVSVLMWVLAMGRWQATLQDAQRRRRIRTLLAACAISALAWLTDPSIQFIRPPLPFPFVPIILLVLTVPAVVLLNRRRSDEPLCPTRSCGYNLTANSSGTCPECGMPIPATLRRRIERAGNLPAKATSGAGGGAGGEQRMQIEK